MRHHLRFVALLVTAASTAQALFFTAPQTGAVWANPNGQVLTWRFQPGDALVGDFNLVSEDRTHSASIATRVDLQRGSLTFPGKVRLTSSTQRYFIEIADSATPSLIYSSVGPFTIQSFRVTPDDTPITTSPAAPPSPSPTTSRPPAPSTTTTVPQTTSSAPPPSSSPSTTTSSAPTTSSTTTTVPIVTVNSTAQAVTITSMSEESMVTVIVTATAQSATQLNSETSRPGGSSRSLRLGWTAAALSCVAVVVTVLL